VTAYLSLPTDRLSHELLHRYLITAGKHIDDIKTEVMTGIRVARSWISYSNNDIHRYSPKFLRLKSSPDCSSPRRLALSAKCLETMPQHEPS
jgi:hypothetical protein